LDDVPVLAAVNPGAATVVVGGGCPRLRSGQRAGQGGTPRCEPSRPGEGRDLNSGVPCPVSVVGVSGLGGGGDGFCGSGVPGSVLLVEGLGSQAAVQDADQPVRNGTEGLVVGGPAGPLSVVELPGSG
jgi:hypothetical protein